MPESSRPFVSFGAAADDVRLCPKAAATGFTDEKKAGRSLPSVSDVSLLAGLAATCYGHTKKSKTHQSKNARLGNLQRPAGDQDAEINRGLRAFFRQEAKAGGGCAGCRTSGRVKWVKRASGLDDAGEILEAVEDETVVQRTECDDENIVAVGGCTDDAAAVIRGL